MGRHLRRLALLAVAASLVGASGVVGLASAQAAQQPDAVIRAAHFSPTTPGVDVYLGSFSGGQAKLWLSGVSYGMVSPYQRLTPGLYTVSMRVHGAAASSPPALSWSLNARSGKAYTVAGVGAGSSVRGVVLDDDIAAPPAGDGRVRVIQAASRAPLATVRAASGPVIASSAPFATTTAYADVRAGHWKVEASASGKSSPAASATVSVVAGTSTSVLVLDAKTAGITIRTVLDSAASATDPVGAVPAGGGGMAAALDGHPRRLMDLVGVAGVAALISGAALLGRGRSRRGARGPAGA